MSDDGARRERRTGLVGALLRLKTDDTACVCTDMRPGRGAAVLVCMALRTAFCGRTFRAFFIRSAAIA